MKGVTSFERGVRGSGLPAPLRPVLGGLVVGALAPRHPAGLASGHGALHLQLDLPASLSMLALILALKGAGVGGLDRQRLSRRPVLRLALHGRALGNLFAAAAPWIFPIPP